MVIDPALPITSQDLIRTEYQAENLPVSFNHSGFRLWERLSDFYLEYYKILSEIMVSVDPKIIVSVHSHESGDHMQIYRPWIEHDERLLINQIESRISEPLNLSGIRIEKVWRKSSCGSNTLDSLMSYHNSPEFMVDGL